MPDKSDTEKTGARYPLDIGTTAENFERPFWVAAGIQRLKVVAVTYSKALYLCVVKSQSIAQKFFRCAFNATLSQ